MSRRCGTLHAHAICEEYRAAATLDRTHDDRDRAEGRRIERPLLVLWSGHGALSTWYADAGGPLALWKDWADDVQGRSVDAGHFFPEEIPEETAGELERFFQGRLACSHDLSRRRPRPAARGE